ncbi:MAG: MOSC domain-containing protein [Microscillaceae bacterium]|nr:MOSC domain-containing protein [Microscillaceae bacterium]
MSQRAVLSEIWSYPIKSCKGISLTRGTVDLFGLHNDRRWMIIHATGGFITQRDHPKMALISAEFLENTMILKASGMKEQAFHFSEESSREEIMVKVWDDETLAELMPQEAHDWISNYLQDDCRLVFMPKHARRQIDLSYALPGQFTSFSDGYPLLLISEASLADLNQRLDQAVSMNRFRPNLVVTGVEPYAEDQWHRITIGEVEFLVAKPCGRCIMTTIDQEAGTVSGKDPLKTLSEYRKFGKKVCFGQNLIQLRQGQIQVGDTVEITLISHK